MTKRVSISVFVFLIATFGVLTHLGRDLLPSAPLNRAWVVPFGDSGYIIGVRAVIKNGDSEEEVIEHLGEPSTRFSSAARDGRFSLAYPISNQVPPKEFLISFDASGRVLQVFDID